MPELPDLTIYIECLKARVEGITLERVRIAHPFLLRSIDPRPAEGEGKRVLGVGRIGKHVVLELEDQLFFVFHLMITGRFHWKEKGAKVPGKIGLAALDFPNGTLVLTEAGSKRRASLHVVRGKGALRVFDKGGIEPQGTSLDSFRAALTRENHTLKRALTDPRILSGVGNAYSDEILHRAKLSPVATAARLTNEEIVRLFEAVGTVLAEWTDRIRREAGGAFPERVTAFREGMAVHGRYAKPCPACGSPVQRIVYAENEADYCPTCQTGGRLLADRALSRLLKGEWPRTLKELEGLMEARGLHKENSAD
jgi:formamidopyrimidine-DNA glycosylase